MKKWDRAPARTAKTASISPHQAWCQRLGFT